MVWLSAVWTWITSNKKLSMAIAGVALVATLGFYIYHKGGENTENAMLVESYEKVLEINEKQAEIRANRPDTEQLFDILHSGDF